MKIYTRTGDKGETGLFGGGRVSKASARVEAYGEVDELNSFIGLARAAQPDGDVDALLADVQSALFDMGAELASKKEGAAAKQVTEDDVRALEQAIDRFEQELEPLRNFVLPGGSMQAAQLHVARTVARRAERRLVVLSDHDSVRGELLRYLNRLSDVLFVVARVANARAGIADVPWIGRGGA